MIRVYTLIITMLALPCNAELLKLSSRDLGAIPFTINNQFGGFIGDTISLDAGRHSITIKGEHKYTFTVSLDVSDNIHIRSAQPMRWSDCINQRVSQFELESWPAPIVQKSDGYFEIILSTPVYKNIGDQGECGEKPSMLTLNNLGKITLIVTSTPHNAEIWIRGKLIATTNSQVVIPYTNGDRKPIQVVVRRQGFASCIETVNLPKIGDTTVNLSCDLKELGS